MISIKVLNISLVLLCIFITAFLCTFLAITSSDKALDDTKHSRDASVSSAFETGEQGVTNRTVEYLGVVMANTVMFIEEFTNDQRKVAVSIARRIMAEPWDTVKMWEWHRKADYYITYDLVRWQGLSSIGIVLKNNMLYAIYEGSETMANPPDGYHYVNLVLNYGSDNPSGGLGRSFLASCDNGFPAGVTDPLTDVNWIGNATYPCVHRALATNGTQPDDPCIAKYSGNPAVSPVYQMSSSLPPGSSMWTNPVTFGGAFVAINCYAPVHHSGQHSGYVNSGADLRHISNYLSTQEIGGPVGGYPSRARVFVTLRSTWADSTQVGKMVAASHGEIIGYVNGSPSPVSLYPIDSSDHVISSVANVTLQQGLTPEVVSVSQHLTVLNITTELAPEGEPFLLQVWGRWQRPRRTSEYRRTMLTVT
eukprot:TRINITY_DN1237_c0_g4_i1.p1 TRINITY_DN1237_c0_g4~~TRINITY_DN1237_c0_g4_i1.p1  ORF type:complete len:421 (+),score=98.23 TRINITY_DN1237_c0_g4_i1:47-1309(+)